MEFFELLDSYGKAGILRNLLGAVSGIHFGMVSAGSKRVVPENRISDLRPRRHIEWAELAVHDAFFPNLSGLHRYLYIL